MSTSVTTTLSGMGQVQSSGAFGMTGGIGDMISKRITHLEIRRVQNGFVVMGFDAETNEQTYQTTGVKCCMIANNAQELAALVENIINGSDLKWLPSVDIPITGLFERRA